MPDHETVGPTRREYIAYGGVVAGGGALAGCTTSDPTSNTSSSGNTSDTSSSGNTSGPYEACIEPMGCTTFEETPTEWISYQYAYGDMGIALGQADGYLGTNNPGGYPDFFYNELAAVEFDASTLTNIGGGDKEVFYQLDPDVMFLDPNNARARFEWEESDVTELENNLAPFFGHFGRRYGYSIQDGYPQLGLYDIFESVATVFQERERYERIKTIHDETLDEIQGQLPGEARGSERPEVALLSGGSDPSGGRLFLMSAQAPGYGRKQYRDLGVRDARTRVDAESQFHQIDFEGLLELDPENIVFHWTVQMSDEEFRAQFVEPLENDPVAGDLTAVENGRVFRGGAAEQGPLINLFQTERAAQQFYPDIFGDEERFSRADLSAAVDGR